MKRAPLCFFEECYREAEVAEETEETIGLVVPFATLVHDWHCDI
jgi:hypothetical protein